MNTSMVHSINVAPSMRSIQIITNCLLLFAVLRTTAFAFPSSLHYGSGALSTTASRSDGSYRKFVRALNQYTRVGDSREMSSAVSSNTESQKNFSELPMRSGGPLKTFSDGYSRLTSEHYLLMAFLQAGFLASAADITTQTLEGASPLDIGHVAAMATVASTMSGGMNAVWLRQLEQAFPGTKTREVATKTLIHAILLASIINSAYLVGVPLFTEYFYNGSGGFSLPPMDPSILSGGWTLDEFIILTKLEVMMFIPYNTLAFKFIPPQVRPLTHAAVSAIFNIAISAVTLGYFNIWCERATALFSS
jgi:hypothetical protein